MLAGTEMLGESPPVARSTTKFLSSDGLLVRVATVVSLMGAAAGVFVLASLMTHYGLGNGFCLLILSDPVAQLLSESLGQPGFASSAVRWDFVHWIVAAIVVTALVHRFRGFRRPSVRRSTTAPTKETRAGTVAHGFCPAPPRVGAGLLDSSAAEGGLRSGGLARVRSSDGHGLHPLPTRPRGDVPFFGAITTLLFSNRGRLESNLPNPDLPEDFGDTLLQRVVGSTALLVAVAVGLLALGAFTFHSSELDAVFLVGLAAVVADLIEEWRFRRRHPEAAELAQLDNVHLALFLARDLHQRGIATWTRAFHYRSLLFFFGPLFKMTLHVPADRLEEARERLNALDPQIV